MKFKMHNKLEVVLGEKTFVFYNKMLDSVLSALVKFDKYNDFIAIGNGVPGNNEKTQKLSNFIKKYSLKSEIIQNNIKLGELFVKKSLVLDELENACEYITEVGLCDDANDNPTIYNYITLISDDTPLGIKKNAGEKLLMNIYIYLDLSPETEGLFCEGKNALVGFLLGEGLNDEIYVFRGDNFAENNLIKRGIPTTDISFLANKNAVVENGELTINFDADLGAGETNELVFVCGESVVARMNVLNHKASDEVTQEFVSKENNTLDLGKDVKEVISVKNVSTGEGTNDICLKKYATSFSDKISTPFNEFVNYQTPRFVSKDSKLIFFVKDDYVHGYRNQNFSFSEIVTGNLSLQHIRNIVSFDNFVFIITKFSPFVHAFLIDENDILIKIPFDFGSFQYIAEFENLLFIDIVMSKTGRLMLATNLEDGKGVTAYFAYDEINAKFVYEECLVSEYEFSYLLAMHKNNFSDACIMYIKGSEYSYECRIVTHYADKTLRDVATLLAYDYSFDTKEIYANDRAVVVEKNTKPYVYIYYYPQVVVYNLPLGNSEIDNYFSNNLLYLIQKYEGNSYKIFNLVDYDEVKEFQTSLSDYVDESKIEGFEFMNDSLIIFLNDEQNPVIALNFKLDGVVIENVQQALSSYQVTYKKYNKIGKNNEGVKASICLKIKL